MLLGLSPDAALRHLVSGNPKTSQPSAKQFVAVDGVVRDLLNKLEWRAADNGQDISWVNAKEYCGAQGWELPTQKQLLSLFDVSGTLATPCGSTRCKISPVFTLTSRYGFVWSSERAGSAEAWYLAMDFGTRSATPVESAMATRALCVRAFNGTLGSQ
jgi:Protein of unknown function (DUF1566)